MDGERNNVVLPLRCHPPFPILRTVPHRSPFRLLFLSRPFPEFCACPLSGFPSSAFRPCSPTLPLLDRSPPLFRPTSCPLDFPLELDFDFVAICSPVLPSLEFVSPRLSLSLALPLDFSLLATFSIDNPFFRALDQNPVQGAVVPLPLNKVSCQSFRNLGLGKRGRAASHPSSQRLNSLSPPPLIRRVLRVLRFWPMRVSPGRGRSGPLGPGPTFSLPSLYSWSKAGTYFSIPSSLISFQTSDQITQLSPYFLIRHKTIQMPWPHKHYSDPYDNSQF